MQVTYDDIWDYIPLMVIASLIVFLALYEVVLWIKRKMK